MDLKRGRPAADLPGMVRQSTAARAPQGAPIPGGSGAASEASVESYRRLAEVFHEVLSEQSLDAVLEKIAAALADLMPYEALHIYEADEDRRELRPLLARSQEFEVEIMNSRPRFGEGITGWAVANRRPVWSNRAHLDPRTVVIPGTSNDPEAMITVPLIARGALKGALNIYRIGEDAGFAEHEFELAKWFGDAAALAIDNAQIRARLEHLAQTDSLTGLFNHRYFHERLRSELTRASRSHDSVAVLMFDLDDFKRVNDVYGHGAGDQLLIQIARIARDAVRASDVVCRIGGEEFGVIMPSCDAGDALGLAVRLREAIERAEFEPAGRMTLSMGVAQGPEHAMNPRELVACAEAAMMTAKARGKNQSVLYDDGPAERPVPSGGRDVRSIAHLKMLQSLAGKLNRLNDVTQIGNVIATELRQLIDYHNCRVVLRDGDRLFPVAFVGDYDESLGTDAYIQTVGVGVTGRAVEIGEPLLVPNALECAFAYRIPGTDDIEESLAVVPLRYGSRVTGAIVISKLGVNQFDDDDVRLLEVLAGQASVALENARLYERQRREAEGAKALLAFADDLSLAHSVDEICELAVEALTRMFETPRASIWLGEVCVASLGEPLAEGATAPLAEGEGIHGRLVVDVPELDDDQARLLTAFAYQLSVALQKARLYWKQMEAAEIANALLDAGRELATAESPEEVLGRAAEVTARVLGSGRAALWIEEEGAPHDLLARASYGYAPELDPAGSRRFAHDLAHHWLERSEPFVLEPEDVADIAGADTTGIARILVAPLRLEGSRVGALTASVESRDVDDRQLRLLAGLAHQAKLAIESAEHYEGLERTFVATVATLANALEASDEYTSSHARWITDMSLLVGRELDLDRDAMKRLEFGALFHDIGKIGIPSEILRKPGPLTDEEFEIVKEHPELGEKILAPIDRLSDVRPIVRACHERWDGLGYPDGKAGTDIPLEARIVLVCDAYHAMVTDRPYRRRLDPSVAVSRLVDAAGSQFDPNVVDVFVRIFEAGGVLPL
ncbi:MAG TPA: diguanylate cyclase [Gaiellaceae bacterium]|nr:diguanylate cyclase [Gaiellaceae bacterium]